MHTYLHIHPHTYTHMHIYIYIHTYAYIHIHTSIKNIYAYKPTYIPVHAHTYLHTPTYTYVYVYFHTYLCIYIHTHKHIYNTLIYIPPVFWLSYLSTHTMPIMILIVTGSLMEASTNKSPVLGPRYQLL